MDGNSTNGQLWQAWLKMDNGGYLGIPYVAVNIDEARKFAHAAQEMFGGTLIEFRKIKRTTFNDGRGQSN